MLLLASFLAFWLYGEYQREKMALQNKSYLGIAEKLIGQSGGDLYDILSDLENFPKDSFVFVDWHFSDSIDIRRMEDTSRVRRSKVKYIGGDFSSEDLIKTDSFQELSKTVKTKDGEASIAIVLKSDHLNHTLSHDSVTGSLSLEFMEMMQGDLKKDKAALQQDALRNIIPEFLFAVFLFALLTLGIYLLQKTNAKEQELLESKNNLISNLTHELKTPITTIGIALEAIQDFNVKSDKEKTALYIQTSRTELNRLSAVIDQVMLLSKLGTDSEIYDFQEQEMRPLCEEVIQNLKLQIEKKEASVHLHTDENIKAIVDESHFKQLLYNLIDNALKYGAKAVEIDVRLKNENNKFTMSVSDNGSGFDPKYHNKVFERFYRISNGDRHDVKGYGLGLSYVKEIVEAHKGMIRIESEKGKGTTCIVVLPNL